MKQRKESEKKDNRKRSSSGDMFMKGRTMMESIGKRSGNGVNLNISSGLYGDSGARNSIRSSSPTSNPPLPYFHHQQHHLK
jgi:hypothetical protein